MNMPAMDLPEPVVRNLRREDLEALVRIDSLATGYPRDHYFARKFERMFSEESHLLLSLAAEVGGRVVGYIMGESNTGEYGIPEAVASIDTIGVDPEYQRLGVGRILLEDYCALAAKAGVERMTTLVSTEDRELRDFFTAHGFRPAPMTALDRRLA